MFTTPFMIDSLTRALRGIGCGVVIVIAIAIVTFLVSLAYLTLLP